MQLQDGPKNAPRISQFPAKSVGQGLPWILHIPATSVEAGCPALGATSTAQEGLKIVQELFKTASRQPKIAPGQPTEESKTASSWPSKASAETQDGLRGPWTPQDGPTTNPRDTPRQPHAPSEPQRRPSFG